MATKDSPAWLDASDAAQEALQIAKRIEARQKALAQLTMHMLAVLAKSTPKEQIDQLLAELERMRDLTGPAGVVAGEVVVTAMATLERVAKR